MPSTPTTRVESWGATPRRRGNRLKRMFIIAVALCIALAAGCAKSGGDQSATADAVTGINAPDALPRVASIPGLEFVAASEFPDGDAIKPGDTLTAGSYKPGATGKDISAVQWVIGEDDGINRLMLGVQFNEAGAKALASLTKANLEKRMLIVLDGRVIGDTSLYEPIETGAITLTSPDVLAARAEVDAATTPLK